MGAENLGYVDKNKNKPTTSNSSSPAVNRNNPTTTAPSKPKTSPVDLASNVVKSLAGGVGAGVAEFEKDPLRGRKVISDEEYQSLVGLGYDEATLRQTYLPKSQEALAKKMGEMFWKAPAFNQPKEEDAAAKDQSMRSMVTQMVLAPYLRQIGTDFNNMRGGLQQTQAKLMEQIDPTYRPYLEAMNNATYAAQDQSWIDAINSMAITPVMDQQNQLIAEYINQLKNQDAAGGDPFLTALMNGQISG